MSEDEWKTSIAERANDAAATRAVLAQSRPHYVYVLCRADGTPFYVGKGVSLRCFHHEAEAGRPLGLSHKLNVIRSLYRRGEAVRYCIESSFDNEQEAHQRERELIALIGRHDQGRGPLTNQTDGGEGASNPSAESRERRRQSLWGEAADEERKVANRWFQSLCDVQSVPIKPIQGSFKLEKLYPNRDRFSFSTRQAAALAASAIANRVLLEPGSIIPRHLCVEGVNLAIENGVGRDILSSKMATLANSTEGQEAFALTPDGLTFLITTIGENVLIDAGVYSPTYQSR